MNENQENKVKKENGMPKMMPKILYIDDETYNLAALKAALRREFEVHTALSAKEGLKILNEEAIQIIISDQRMPEMTGVEFFASIKEAHSEPIRILLTGYSDMQSVVDAINRGEVYRYLTKPWDATYLKSIITQALELFELRRKNKELVADLKRANGQLEFYLRQKLLS